MKKSLPAALNIDVFKMKMSIQANMKSVCLEGMSSMQLQIIPEPTQGLPATSM